jgi:hypothetical protein
LREDEEPNEEFDIESQADSDDELLLDGRYLQPLPMYWHYKKEICGEAPGAPNRFEKVTVFPIVLHRRGLFSLDQLHEPS